jgi:hypothetical protein
VAGHGRSRLPLGVKRCYVPHHYVPLQNLSSPVVHRQ